MYAAPLIALTGADPALIPLSVTYMHIRAWAQPAVLATMVVQAGLLAQQDSTTPAVTVLVSVVVNVIANVIAIGWLGLGLFGAAITTVLTQLVGTAVLLYVAYTRSELQPGVCIPSWEDLKSFTSTMGPLSVTYLCKNVCYILLQTTAASLDMLRLAAHQVSCHAGVMCVNAVVCETAAARTALRLFVKTTRHSVCNLWVSNMQKLHCVGARTC